ncbi:MAG: insulinase family protein [Tissierellia bacterium]|nr:insulinase family protein [Tissierellia bacterium]
MGIIENKRIDEKLYFRKLDSGLNIYFMPRKGYMQKYAIFATDYGSNDNHFIPIGEREPIKVPAGVAHFLEHKLFEDEEMDIFDRFSRLGTNVNAYTNANQTAYLCSTTANFYESLQLLIKFVQNPYFTDSNVEKEKGIIEQEIRMYEDSPNWRVYSNCLNGMYVDHPVRIDIAGTVESIQDIDKEVLYQCYNTFYNPSNMVLFIAGDLSFERIVDIVEGTERKDLRKGIEEISRVYPNEPVGIQKQYIEDRLATSIPLFSIGIKDNNLNMMNRELVHKDLVTNILLEILFGDSSEFYNDLYGKGLVDNSFTSYFTGKVDYGYSLVLGQSNEPDRVFDKVLKHIKATKKTGISGEAFRRIKNKNMGGFLMGLNSLSLISSYFIDNYFEGFLFIDVLDILDSIEIGDVNARLVDDIDEETMVLSVVNPMS